MGTGQDRGAWEEFMGVHQELDEMITRSGYSVPQIAKATGISDKSIYAYRKGRKIPEAKRAILMEYLRTSERVRVVLDARARARKEKAAEEARRKDAETEARLRQKHLEKRAEGWAMDQERVLRHGGRVTLATEDGKPVHLVVDQNGDLEVRFGRNGECEVSATRHLMKAGTELGVMVDNDGALFIPSDGTWG